MTGAQIIVVMFVVAAYALGWWARAAITQGGTETGDQASRSVVELLESLQQAISPAIDSGQPGDLYVVRAEVTGAVGLDERLDVYVCRAARAARLTISALNRPASQERERRLELIAAEQAARDAADLAAQTVATAGTARRGSGEARRVRRFTAV